LFGAFIAGLQRLTEDQIRDVHRNRRLTLTWVPRCVCYSGS
jgi:hypothetical protein